LVFSKPRPLILHLKSVQARDPRILKHPGLEPFWASIRRDHRWQKTTAMMVVATGLLLTLYTLRPGKLLWPLVGGSLAGVGFWWFLRLYITNPVEGWKEQLQYRPHSIVWVYGLRTERMPFGLNMATSATLYLVDEEGDLHDFGIPAEELKLVTKTLRRVLLSAEFGYTEDRELKYRGTLTRFNGWRDRDPFQLQ
jgi:hypothetical protein